MSVKNARKKYRCEYFYDFAILIIIEKNSIIPSKDHLIL
jgi:hypothetical protein